MLMLFLLFLAFSRQIISKRAIFSRFRNIRLIQTTTHIRHSNRTANQILLLLVRVIYQRPDSINVSRITSGCLFGKFGQVFVVWILVLHQTTLSLHRLSVMGVRLLSIRHLELLVLCPLDRCESPHTRDFSNDRAFH